MNRITIHADGKHSRRLASELCANGRVAISKGVKLYYDPFERSSPKNRTPVGIPCYSFFGHVSSMVLNGVRVAVNTDNIGLLAAACK